MVLKGLTRLTLYLIETPFKTIACKQSISRSDSSCKSCLIRAYSVCYENFIKSPQRSGDTYCFCCVSYYFFPFHFFLFAPKFCTDDFSVTTGRISLKFGNMVDMDVKLCNWVSKFKMSDSKADPRTCAKPLKFCLNGFSLTTEEIVLNCFRYDRY